MVEGATKPGGCVRVGTWNVEWARPSLKKAGPVKAILTAANCDVLCVTEGDAGILPNGGHVIDAGTDWGYPLPKASPGRRKVLLWSKRAWSQEFNRRQEDLPGGRLVVETINPESLFALVRAYVLDPTHTRPVHPQLLSFMAHRSGLTDIDIVYQAEVPEVAQVARVEETPFVEHASSLAVVRELNLRIDQVNEMYAAPQEYALIASRVDATGQTS